MRVLIVEDNEVNLRLMREVLRHQGHDLQAVRTAADAIAALDHGLPPEVVLLDINIPGSGLTVASHIRATSLLAGVTVIAVTALAMSGDRERFLAAGCDGYIAKPISVRTFVAEMETIVKERRAR